jgi:hypothetical protein
MPQGKSGAFVFRTDLPTSSGGGDVDAERRWLVYDAEPYRFKREPLAGPTAVAFAP